MARKQTDFIVIHCSATPPTMDIGRREIDRWHRGAPNHWLMIGYHFVIRRDGTVEAGRPLMDAGAHVNPPEGINRRSIGICMVGGVDKDNKPQNNFTSAQWKALDTLVYELERKFPGAEVVGHGELSKDRACPSFNVKNWMRQRGQLNHKVGALLDPEPLPILKRGAQGRMVLKLQGLLKTVSQTGIFGQTTEERVKEFQKAHGLTADGIVGPKTWAALKQ